MHQNGSLGIPVRIPVLWLWFLAWSRPYYSPRNAFHPTTDSYPFRGNAAGNPKSLRWKAQGAGKRRLKQNIGIKKRDPAASDGS